MVQHKIELDNIKILLDFKSIVVYKLHPKDIFGETTWQYLRGKPVHLVEATEGLMIN